MLKWYSRRRDAPELLQNGKFILILGRYRTALTWRWQRNAIPLFGPLLPDDLAPDDLEGLIARKTCLVIQPMRSGGTLLTRLFDSHAALNVRPYHFVASRTSNRLSGDIWPTDENLNRACASLADLWREFVYDPRFYLFRTHGLPMRLENKAAQELGEGGVDDRPPRMVIDIDCPAYYAAFRKALTLLGGVHAPFTVRDAVAASFAGFFASWRNNRNRNGAKQYNLAHAPRHASTENYLRSCANFFESMPDGKILTVIREPESWVASFHKSGITRLSVEDIVGFYERYLDALGQVISGAPPERFMLVDFRALISSTRETMEGLADFLGIGFADCLCQPTRNGAPETRANTSFPGEARSGLIDTNTLRRGEHLDEGQRRMIRDALAKPYEKVLRLAASRQLLYAV